MTEAGDRHIEQVRRTIDALNRGAPEESLAEARDDFVMDWSNSIGPLQGVYEGRAAVIELWTSFVEAFESIHWEPQEFIEIDESTVIVVNQVRMRGRGSGVEVTAGGAQLWRFDEEGRRQSVKLYQSKEEALAAVGAD